MLLKISRDWLAVVAENVVYLFNFNEGISSFLKTNRVASQEWQCGASLPCAAPFSDRNFQRRIIELSRLFLVCAKIYHRLITYARPDERISWATWRTKKSPTIPGLDSRVWWRCTTWGGISSWSGNQKWRELLWHLYLCFGLRSREEPKEQTDSPP